MDKLIIKGPCQLAGEIKISGAKNAALPLLAATILSPNTVQISNLPKLTDINFFIDILNSLGIKTELRNDNLFVTAKELKTFKADYDLVRKMRASILVLGPLLSRFGKAEVSLPGGCAIGSRPVDIHLEGLKQLGANIIIENGYVKASCDKLIGTHIHLPFPSVGATENILMAACYAEGITLIENAACEPEIDDLANFLNSMGFEVSGIGTPTLSVVGKQETDLCSPRVYPVIGDRIEAATYVIAGLMTNSNIKVTGFNPDHLSAVMESLTKMGAKLEVISNGVEVFPSGTLKGIKVETQPYPGFPTDAQAQLMSLMGISQGYSIISEKIFENRFMHVPELNRMGMKVELDGNYAFIEGTNSLSSAPVMCTDLRASAALVLSALVASGETVINRIYHLDRGYEKLAEKLQSIGANIKRVKE